MTLLITILIFWLGWKLLRWWLVRKFNNRTRDIFEQFSRQSGANSQTQTDQPRRNKTGWDRPATEKKIAREEGEYIEYEEISVSRTETTVSTDLDGNQTETETTTTVTEERITDVEWEDLP